MEDGGEVGGQRSAPIAAAERCILEEVAFMLTSSFSESHKDCAKLLVALSEELGVECSSLFVEVTSG